MKLIFTSYVSSPEFSHPESWLKRINAYTGILESLSNPNAVIGIERINYEGKYEKNGVQYLFVKQRQNTVLIPVHLHRLVKELKPDIVFINGLIFPLQVIQLRLKLGSGVKIILLHRGEKPYRGIKGFVQKLADKCIDAYLFTSAEFGKDWTQQGNIGNQNKIHEVIQASSVFYHQDKTLARSSAGVDGSPVFLWVGRLDANKNPLTVVKAFIQFARFQPGAKLYMIYQSDELLNDIKDLIHQEANTVKPINLVGKIAHEELQTWYNAADFIVSGSHHEGSGIAVCEAMSCGCVPVLTDIISFRKMTGPGNCGLLYEPGNTASLLKILMQTLELDIEKERAKTLQQFKTELSFEAIAKKIAQVIATLKQ